MVFVVLVVVVVVVVVAWALRPRSLLMMPGLRVEVLVLRVVGIVRWLGVVRVAAEASLEEAVCDGRRGREVGYSGSRSWAGEMELWDSVGWHERVIYTSGSYVDMERSKTGFCGVSWIARVKTSCRAKSRAGRLPISHTVHDSRSEYGSGCCVALPIAHEAEDCVLVGAVTRRARLPGTQLERALRSRPA